jgi:hypothetical protein
MSDENKPAGEAVSDEPESEGMPYQVILSIGMVGDPTDQVQLELTAKMTALVDAMRTRFPKRDFQATITDYIMGTEARQI